MNYRAAKHNLIGQLRAGLSPQLSYHGLHHTMDVLRMATKIAELEKIDREDLVLLKTAAIYHDAGFLNNKHAGHEAEGCRLVQEQLPSFGYTAAHIEKICGMIMATKIPQSPANLLEKILCDADLDYLGRNDFWKIGDSLFQELQSYQLITDEFAWNRLQVSFLSAHRFHTHTNQQLREQPKQLYLQQLTDLVATYV